MTSKEVLKRINKSRRIRLAEYVSGHTKYEYYNLYGLYGKLTPSKDKHEQIVLAVKTTHPETIFTNFSVTWRIVVDTIAYEGEHGKATDNSNKYFHIHKCPLPVLKTLFKAAIPQDELETPKKDESTPEKTFAGWKGGRPKLSFSAEEEEKILAMREKGMTIAAIAKELHVGIRRVLRFLHSQESK